MVGNASTWDMSRLSNAVKVPMIIFVIFVHQSYCLYCAAKRVYTMLSALCGGRILTGIPGIIPCGKFGNSMEKAYICRRKLKGGEL